MHRFHPERGFEAPTVYCKEMFLLLSQGVAAARQTLNSESEPNDSPNPMVDLIELCRGWSGRSNCDDDNLTGLESVRISGFAPELTDRFSETIQPCSEDSIDGSSRNTVDFAKSGLLADRGNFCRGRVKLRGLIAAPEPPLGELSP